MQPTGYIRSFDGARALSIMAVMAYHAGLIHYGWAGVQLFFVLSGFLITTILWKEKFRDEPLGYRFRKFWVRRSLRIFPLYFGYLLVLGLAFLVVGFPAYYPTYAPYLWTYTVNYSRLLPEWQGNPLFTHLWSLSIEEQFYIFYPFLIFLLRPGVVRFLLIGGIALAPLLRLVLGMYYGERATPFVAADAVYWNTLSHLDAFFMGAIIPVFGLPECVGKPHRLLGIAGLLALGAGIWNYGATPDPSPYLADLGYHHERVGNYAHVWRYSLLNFVFASLILMLISGRARYVGRLRSLLETRVLVEMGRVSYGMYLFHWIVLVYGFQRFFGTEPGLLRWLWFPLYVVVVYGISALSYRFYEAPFLRLKDRFFPNRHTTRRSVEADPS